MGPKKYIGKSAEGNIVIELVQDGTKLFRRLGEKPFLVTNISEKFRGRGEFDLEKDFVPGSIFVSKEIDESKIREKYDFSPPVESIMPVNFFEDEIKGMKFRVPVSLSPKIYLNFVSRRGLFAGVKVCYFDESVVPPVERRITKMIDAHGTVYKGLDVMHLSDPTMRLFYEKDGQDVELPRPMGPAERVERFNDETDKIIRQLTLGEEGLAKVKSRQAFKPEEHKFCIYVHGREDPYNLIITDKHSDIPGGEGKDIELIDYNVAPPVRRPVVAIKYKEFTVLRGNRDFTDVYLLPGSHIVYEVKPKVGNVQRKEIGPLEYHAQKVASFEDEARDAIEDLMRSVMPRPQMPGFHKALNAEQR